MNLEFETQFFEYFLDSQGKEIRQEYLARRGDVDEGGVLVVVVLVRGGVRTLRRGEGLGNTWRKIEIYMKMHN